MSVALPASLDLVSSEFAPPPPADPAPLPDPVFWPESFVDWAGSVGSVGAVAAIGLTAWTVYRQARWRHEDLVDQRYMAASNVIISVQHDHSRVSELKVDNTGSEPLKGVEVTLLHTKTGERIELRHRTKGPIDVLATHIAGGDTKVWKSWTSDPLPTVADDAGRLLLDVSPQVTWTDAAGWKWRMDSNKAPVNTFRPGRPGKKLFRRSKE